MCQSYLLELLPKALMLFVSEDNTSSHKVMGETGLDVFFGRKAVCPTVFLPSPDILKTKKCCLMPQQYVSRTHPICTASHLVEKKQLLTITATISCILCFAHVTRGFRIQWKAGVRVNDIFLLYKTI